jgi:histidinol dehydrogenase
VDDFVKKMSVISFSREALKKMGSHIIRLAYMEGLEAHARAVEKRLEAEHRNT